jgi:hypothetical protein
MQLAITAGHLPRFKLIPALVLTCLLVDDTHHTSTSDVALTLGIGSLFSILDKEKLRKQQEWS